MNASDPYNLERFLAAQAGAHDTAVAELRNGCKQSHWMWYVFPQLAGLGRSARAQHYGIKSLDEARAYLAHPLLGARLQECAAVLEGLDSSLTASSIFGYPDDLKLRSSLTLFAQAAGPGSIFDRLLDRYFAGQPDELTVAPLQMQGHS